MVVADLWEISSSPAREKHNRGVVVRSHVAIVPTIGGKLPIQAAEGGFSLTSHGLEEWNSPRLDQHELE